MSDDNKIGFDITFHKHEDDKFKINVQPIQYFSFSGESVGTALEELHENLISNIRALEILLKDKNSIDKVEILLTDNSPFMHVNSLTLFPVKEYNAFDIIENLNHDMQKKFDSNAIAERIKGIDKNEPCCDKQQVVDVPKEPQDKESQ